MAAGRHFEIYKNRNNFRTVDPSLTKFDWELQLDTFQRVEFTKNVIFSKSKMAADKKMKFTKK